MNSFKLILLEEFARINGNSVDYESLDKSDFDEVVWNAPNMSLHRYLIDKFGAKSNTSDNSQESVQKESDAPKNKTCSFCKGNIKIGRRIQKIKVCQTCFKKYESGSLTLNDMPDLIITDNERFDKTRTSTEGTLGKMKSSGMVSETESEISTELDNREIKPIVRGKRKINLVQSSSQSELLSDATTTDIQADPVTQVVFLKKRERDQEDLL
jgi:ribosomal protein L37AE/L43A